MTRPGLRQYRFLAALLVIGLAVGCFPGRAGADTLPNPAEVAQRMIARAQAVASADHAPLYTYQKHALHEWLTAAGQVAKSEDRTYQVTLIAGFPFKRLVKIQGRDLSPAELEEQDRKEERFRQRLLSAEARPVRKEGISRDGWVTRELLDRYEFAIVERLSLSNRPTLVVTFKPKSDSLPARSLLDRVLNRLHGTIWVDEAEAEAARLLVSLTDVVTLGWLGAVGSLSKCDVRLERRRMPDGVWLNADEFLLIHYRKLASTTRFRSSERSSGFQRADGSKTLDPAK